MEFIYDFTGDDDLLFNRCESVDAYFCESLVECVCVLGGGRVVLVVVRSVTRGGWVGGW